MTAPTTDQEYAGVDEYFAGDGALDDALTDAGIDELLDEGPAKKTGLDPKRHIAPIPGGGKLLEANWQTVYKILSEAVQRQERLRRNRAEEALHCERIARNVPFSYLEKSEDRSVYKAALPPFIEDTGHPVPNKVADLRKKIVSQLTVDDFLPNPKPSSDSDRDRGAADLSKKFLRTDATAAGTNDKQMLREVLLSNMLRKSAFAQLWIDPTGGGWRPMQLKAHPDATDPKRPLYGPKIGPDGVALADKETGEPLMLVRTSSPVLRYVAEDEQTGEQTFVDDAAAAARQWLPRIRRTVLQASQVCTVPFTAGVPEASQVILLMWDSLGEAKKRFPILNELGQEQLAKIANWRPKWWKSVVPQAMRGLINAREGTKTATDDTIMFWLQSYCRIGDTYMDGADVAVSGVDSGFGLKRDTLREDVTLDDGTSVPVLLPVPLAQFICLQDTDDGDPMGHPMIRDFEGGNEAYAQIWMGMLEAVEKALHRNVMIPGTSPITGAEWRRRDETPLEIMSAEDEPKYEQAPEVPEFVPKMLEMIELVMNTEAQTNETSNGLDSQYSVSGVAKEIAIKQARTGLAQYWQNTVNGLQQFWTIKLALAKAYYTVPQQVKLSGIESAYKQPWWIGSDLIGVDEVALSPGSGTMMQPAEKVNMLGIMVQQGFIDKEQAAEVARSAMSDDLGIEPNIHEERINRCIALWAEGAPPGYIDLVHANQQKQQQYQAAIQQRVAVLTQGAVDPATGAAMPGLDEQTASAQAQQEIPPPELEELPPSPFDERPNDEDPAVALIQYRRMNRFASTTEWSKHEPEWQQLFNERFQQVRQRAGVVTVAEKQQQESQAAQDQRFAKFVQTIDEKVQAKVQEEIAKVVDGALEQPEANAEQAAEADAADADREHEAAEAERQRAHEAEQKEKDREHEAEMKARDAMSKEAIAARRENRPTQTAKR